MTPEEIAERDRLAERGRKAIESLVAKDLSAIKQRLEERTGLSLQDPNVRAELERMRDERIGMVNRPDELPARLIEIEKEVCERLLGAHPATDGPTQGTVR